MFHKDEETREEAVLYIDNRYGEYLAYLEYIKEKSEKEKEPEKEDSGEIIFQM